VKNIWVNEIKKVLCTLVLVLICSTTVHANQIDGFQRLIPDNNLPVGGWQPPVAHEIEENVQTPEITKQTRLFNSDPNSLFSKGVGTRGYDSLTPKQKQYYLQFDQAADRFMYATGDLEATNLHGEQVYVVAELKYALLKLDFNAAFQVYLAYDYDHPAYYWISNSYWYSSNSIFLCTDAEYASAETRKTINNKIIKGVNEYVALASEGENTLDKIAIIHDKIVQNVDYAYVSGTSIPETAKWAHSVQGVFDENYHQVVCEGYADVFSLLMNYMGIPNYYIVGTANSSGTGGGGGHAWNAVSDDDGETYMYVDLTWDDCAEDGYYYYYFGMPKSDFEKSHYAYNSSGTGYEWLYKLPNSINNSFDGTYYCRGGFYCDTLDCSDFVKFINIKSHRFGTKITYMTSSTEIAEKVAETLGDTNGTYYTEKYLSKTYYIVNLDTNTLIDITDAVVTMPHDACEYSPFGNTPDPESVILHGVKLVKDKNYTLSYANNIDIGENTAKVIITGVGNFKGTIDNVVFSITRKQLSVVGTKVDDKVYDGTTKAVVSYAGTLYGNYTNDEVTFDKSNVNAEFVSRNAGKNKQIRLSGYVLSGKDAWKYSLDELVITTATEISAKPVTVSWSDDEFTYDGQLHCPTATVVGVLDGDTCDAIVEGAQINVGLHNAVVTGLSNSNYELIGETTKSFAIKTVDGKLKTEEQTTSEVIVTTEKATEITPSKTLTTSYSCTSKSKIKKAVVPKTITVNGVEYKVTYISDNAFKGAKKLTSVDIPNSAEGIGNNVFSKCPKLKVVIIRTTKLTSKSVKKNAFKGISNKTVVKVPKKMLKKYTKLFRKKGLSKNVKIKKI